MATTSKFPLWAKILLGVFILAAIIVPIVLLVKPKSGSGSSGPGPSPSSAHQGACCTTLGCNDNTSGPPDCNYLGGTFYPGKYCADFTCPSPGPGPGPGPSPSPPGPGPSPSPPSPGPSPSPPGPGPSPSPVPGPSDYNVYNGQCRYNGKDEYIRWSDHGDAKNTTDCLNACNDNANCQGFEIRDDGSNCQLFGSDGIHPGKGQTPEINGGDDPATASTHCYIKKNFPSVNYTGSVGICRTSDLKYPKWREIAKGGDGANVEVCMTACDDHPDCKAFSTTSTHPWKSFLQTGRDCQLFGDSVAKDKYFVVQGNCGDDCTITEGDPAAGPEYMCYIKTD